MNLSELVATHYKQIGYDNNKKLIEQNRLITLIATTDCNLMCSYCYARAGETPKEMEPWMAHKAIEFAMKDFKQESSKETTISFFGGEPTLNFDLIKSVIQKMEEKYNPFVPVISTNGVISDSVLDYVIEKKFFVKLGADGPPNIQDKYRILPNGQGGTSKFVEKTIRKLSDANLPPRVRVTLTRETLPKVGEIVDYFANLGVSAIHLEAVSPRGRAESFERVDSQEYTNSMLFALDRCREQNILFVNSALLKIFAPSKHYCSSMAGEKYIFTPDGLITGCLESQCSRNSPNEFIFGKYNNAKETFEYDFSYVNKLLPNVSDKIQRCSDCSIVEMCGGGCPMRNFGVSGNISKIDDWQCETRKGLIESVLRKMYEEGE